MVRIGGVGLATTLVIIPIQLVVFVLWPVADMHSAVDWFTLLQENRIAGLVGLDVLLLVDWILLLPVYLVFFVTLKRVNASWTTLALGLWFVAFAGFLASNPSLEMAVLSDRYMAAASEDERAALRAAGEALLVQWEGTAFQVSYILGQAAGIVIGIVMLRSNHYGRAEAGLLIAGNTIGFGYYLPEIGLVVSALSGLVLWVWYGMAARTLFRMGWARRPMNERMEPS